MPDQRAAGSSLIKCQKCDRRVAPMSDGKCPGCGRLLADTEAVSVDITPVGNGAVTPPEQNPPETAQVGRHIVLILVMASVLLLAAALLWRQHADTEALRQDIANLRTGLQVRLDQSDEKVIAATTATRDDVTRALGTESGRILEATAAAKEDILRILAKDAAPAGNSAVVGAKQAAAGQRALDLGRKAIEAGQADKALLYFINGVNHDPSRMELVQSVADAALKSGTNELVERALGIMELTTMQVAPDDMSTVLDRIAELRAKVAPPPAPKLSPEDAAKRVEEMWATYGPDVVWNDGARVAQGLSEIEQYEQMVEVSRADVNDERYSAAITKSEELAEKLRYVQGVLPLYQHTAACVAQMKAIAADDAPDAARFSSVSASGQGVLAQVWGSVDALPQAMQQELRSLPAQMREAEENLQAKMSAVPLGRAVALINRAMEDQSGSFTERIERVTEASEGAAREADAVTSSESRLKLFGSIRAARDRLLELELGRRAAYQKWALDCLNGFMVDWNKMHSVSDVDAKQFYKSHHIAQIDETLLVPEVARVLGRVMTCMTGELNATDGSTVDWQMASTIKKRLEEL